MAIFAAAGCQSRKIGSACKTSAECDIYGGRQCDLSFAVGRNGECTIENCSVDSCPKEAECILNYDARFLSIACDPLREDVEPGFDTCASYQICLPEGLCSDATQGRTSCRQRCSKDSDCRKDYRCTPTGIGGIYVLPDADHPERTKETRICTPKG
jgi:hypothetical protein